MPYSKIILSTHAFIAKKELGEATVQKARRVFTLSSKFDPNATLEVYAETADSFGFPLHYRNYAQHTDTLIDERSLGKAAKFSMCDGFELRDNQKPLIEQFLQSIAKGKTGWLLSMATGGGKTTVCCRMLQELGRTALVIVPRDHLAKQWAERLMQFTTLTQDDIGLAQQNICDYKGKQVVIGTIHSLCKDKYPAAFKEYFGVVVWDEAHVAGAQTFSRTIAMFPAKYRIGMSATMERKDGLEEAYKLAIGEVVLSPAKISTLIQPKVFLRGYATKSKHPYLAKMKDAKSRRGVLISELAKDLPRNALIAVYAKKFADSGRRVVVFSDRVDQLRLLCDILTKRHGMSRAAIGLFTGSTKEANRKIILENSQIILATYGVMAMGIDVPDLRAVIFGTPLSDVAQSVGRILRLCEGAKDPVVLDIVDTAYYDCTRWARSRRQYYIETAKAKLYEVT